jgi:hypothetical protein
MKDWRLDKKKDHYETYEISEIFPFRIFETFKFESETDQINRLGVEAKELIVPKYRQSNDNPDNIYIIGCDKVRLWDNTRPITLADI